MYVHSSAHTGTDARKDAPYLCQQIIVEDGKKFEKFEKSQEVCVLIMIVDSDLPLYDRI
jgi:hypothetical protein